MRSPLVSIIILNWNGRRHLETCLDSVFGQSYQEFQVILVDNGSIDESVPYVKERFPQVRLLELPENAGFARGCNLGLAAADGDYLALLNNDTELHPDWLGELVTALDQHPEVDYCASKILRFDQRRVIDSAGDIFTVAGSPKKRGEGQFDGPDFSYQTIIFGACAGAALYRRSVFDRIGYFDETFFAYHEDTDLNLRALRAGLTCLYVPQAMVYHKVSGTLGPGSDFVTFYNHRNVELAYFKNMPSRLMIKYLPCLVVIRGLAFIYWAWQGRAGSFLRGKLAFLKLLPYVIKERRRLAPQRPVDIQSFERALEKDWFWTQVRDRLPSRSVKSCIL
ncbi:MAG: glycosyltransferase family 2 protein [Deltaproteobacteria bacterium]|nr:glycosyltransferase family 2 protein [Deltaproteobacteria bacterium]